ncbi:hypothetical protein COX69_01465 [Candidatus Falkowbacteria bacterium CG_4_10_14_0_2_um_filter_48_10]|uniref:DUF3566 domain-containing protein n=1 Tax=Candidatus Falkowbacteria bacterium CG23_combo_of_CG06-09_8_20_14_all_49_15 TaxID=1974572 RepID=A0A2G9ZNG6_9BACT|nr:MAG: hypothetical protein COX22_02100 [Candidatus Falkowbacteria bacterium CG23_combo_of_CG06-09_8_20_14_all_49_15]PJA08738.1 MAG: hypothetical protein COX69_01465 [Candidatus Falkowbacteria bacterium CG_4_10_14_0_2_um_filter_48_10]
MQVLTKIKPVSFGRISAAIYLAIGLAAGLVMFFLSVAGAVFGQSPASGRTSLFIGLVMLIILPIFYGALGFAIGWIGGLVYNLAAKWFGGLEVEIKEKEDRPA